MDDFSGHQELEKLKPRLEQALAAVKRKERGWFFQVSSFARLGILGELCSNKG